MDFKNKYLKYKEKYLDLKMTGGYLLSLSIALDSYSQNITIHCQSNKTVGEVKELIYSKLKTKYPKQTNISPIHQTLKIIDKKSETVLKNEDTISSYIDSNKDQQLKLFLDPSTVPHVEPKTKPTFEETINKKLEDMEENLMSILEQIQEYQHGHGEAVDEGLQWMQRKLGSLGDMVRILQSKR